MEAPERININPDMTFVEIDDPLVEYVRADLCTMPGELVERLKKLTIPGYLGGSWWSKVAALSLLEDILAWHEGKK